jgi:lysophospholipase L1-like esterase
MRHRKSFLTLFLVLVIYFVIIEFICRYHESHRQLSPIETLIPNPIYHHAWKPNLNYVDNNREIPYSIITNDQGWEGNRQYSREKLPNVYRIFFMGDSTTFAVVASGKKMTDIVERELNDNATASGRKVEIINTGTSSFSILTYYLEIKNEILKHHPDLVVINVDMTDVPNDFAYRKFLRTDKDSLPQAISPFMESTNTRTILTPHGYIEEKGLPLMIAKWLEPLGKYLTVFRLLRIRLLSQNINASYGNTMLVTPGNPADWLSPVWTDEITSNVNYSMNILKETLHVLSANHIKVILSGVPHYLQYTGQWSAKPHEILENVAKDEYIPFFNSYEALRGRISDSSQEKYYWQSDPTHFNEEGNRIWAEEYVRFFREHPELLNQ